MAVPGDVTIAQDGAGNVKLHPYLVTLIRWCVSCVWSTASVLLHRLVLTPLPQIKASKQSTKAVPKMRQAGKEHLHPEPKVECVVLHTPEHPTLDAIFVHGLYGSLANTWRQGDWRAKYKLDPQKISLRNHTTPCECQTKNENQYNINYTYETNLNETELNETVSFKHINSCFDKILPNENTLITEKFYNNTLLDVNVNTYETQAKFVSEMFKNETKNCDINIDTFKCKLNGNKCKCKLNDNTKLHECICNLNDEIKVDKCKIGCGCVCDDCYSYCWPKDWIKEDFPGARIISINYTSDPYLWRPLWVKGNKRLRLHERAEQMMEQLLGLGVGERPIVWVGHSKGGLFIKQIYCEAYDAYNKINKIKIDNKYEDQNEKTKTPKNIDNNFNIFNENSEAYNIDTIISDEKHNKYIKTTEKTNNILLSQYFLNNNDHRHDNFIQSVSNLQKCSNILKKDLNFFKYTEDKDTEVCGCTENDDFEEDKQVLIEDELIDISVQNDEEIENMDANEDRNRRMKILSSNNEEDIQCLQAKCSLWQQSAGFMFYSVPHRGSPLADIKTPITARSIELLEISKDCDLVVDLQERWLVATSTSRPVVRSLVETCRTLMSVLWLRIVSVDSADAGVGSLYGVSVDHREICKPSSRSCLLYTELTSLIQTAINTCQCRTKDKFENELKT